MNEDRGGAVAGSGTTPLSDELDARKARVWTSRIVEFECVRRIADEVFDSFFEGLPDHYWGWRQHFLGTLFISSCERVVSVGGWPWWVPKWLARRSVAAIAARHDAGGDARFVVERCVLAGRAASTKPRTVLRPD